MNDAEFEAYVAQHLAGGIELQATVLKAGESIRERSKQAYGSLLLDARLQLLAVAAEVVRVKAGQPGTATKNTNDRLILTAAFLQGVAATEELISEGQYLKAAAALKQDLEILSRIHETMQGAAKPKVTPNPSYVPGNAGRLYGQLNNVAHPSDPGLLATLLTTMVDGEAHGVSYEPCFVQETAVGLYEVHVWLILEICRSMMEVLLDMYGDDPDLKPLMRWWLTVAHQLLEEGHLAQVAPAI